MQYSVPPMLPCIRHYLLLRDYYSNIQERKTGEDVRETQVRDRSTACERCSVLRKIKRGVCMRGRKDESGFRSRNCKARIFWYELVPVCHDERIVIAGCAQHRNRGIYRVSTCNIRYSRVQRVKHYKIVDQ